MRSHQIVKSLRSAAIRILRAVTDTSDAGQTGNLAPQVWSLSIRRLSDALEAGEIIEAPLVDDPIRHFTRPAWEEVQCEIPQRLPDAPDNVVAEIWGKRSLSKRASDSASGRDTEHRLHRLSIHANAV